MEDFKNRYKSCEQLDLIIGKNNTGVVEVILTDGTNCDTMFRYLKEQTEREDFGVKATRDLMHVHVLGDRLAGAVQNPLRKVSPKEYVERCVKVAR